MMRISIRTEILLFFVFISTFVMILTGVLLFEVYKNNLTEQIESEARYAMEENSDSINRLVHQFELGGSYVANSDVIINLLQNATENELEQDTAIALLSNEIRSIYDLTLAPVLDNYTTSFYVNSDVIFSQRLLRGTEQSLQSKSRISLYSIEGMEGIFWVQECMKKYGDFYCFRLDEDSPYIYFAKAIYGTERISLHSSFLGISILGFDCRQLINRFERLRAASNMSFVILDQSGKLLANSLDVPMEQLSKLLQTADIASVAPAKVLRQQNHIIQIDKTDIGFTLLSFLAENEIYMQTKDILHFWFLVIVVVSVLILLCSYLVSLHLAKPIQQLAYYMKNTNGTEILKMNVRSSSNIEMDYLYESFNELINKVSKLMSEIEQKNLISKELEMNMFQLQINPHFLYNTLDSIAWRSMASGQSEVADMVGSLSRIFHYSVENGSLAADLIDEVEIVKEYVSLQSKRYSNKFILKTDIPEACRHFQVPRCILQPVVENAIIHGNEGRNDVLEIVISAQMTEQYLEIRIQNNGNRCDEKLLNDYLSGNIRLLKNGEMGIKNINRRLFLRYGEGSRLYYESSEYGGVIAVLHIKLNEEGEIIK